MASLSLCMQLLTTREVTRKKERKKNVNSNQTRLVGTGFYHWFVLAWIWLPRIAMLVISFSRSLSRSHSRFRIFFYLKLPSRLLIGELASCLQNPI
jgi:hypothetical protein